MRRIIIFMTAALLTASVSYAQSEIVTDFKPACDSLAALLHERTSVQGGLVLKSVMRRGTSLDFYFTESLGDFPWYQGDPKWFRNNLGKLFPEKYRKYKVGEIYSRRVSLTNLVTPVLTGDGKPADSRQKVKKPQEAPAIVTALDRRSHDKGLKGRHIAVWQSHGRYYDGTEDRWQWQRPCLFQTCEDMFTQSFVLPFLVPMLENAGAYVMLPRERDTQVNEVIVDNDSTWLDGTVRNMAGWEGAARGTGEYSEDGAWKDAGKGFADRKETYAGLETPFGTGTARMAECIPYGKKGGLAVAEWTPEIPERGRYAVYISYSSLPNSSTSACYTVRHMGGVSRFAVNQKMGGGTWIYLGTFEFDEGSEGSVTLENRTPEGWRHAAGSVVTADAVRFGGGMGNVERGGSVSGLPRSAEAARYWLQWAGADTTVWHLNKGKDDYRDDFMSRGDWVTWMSRGSRVNPCKEGGKGIPFDLSLGFHSDAGVTPGDSIVGTLAIYTLKSERTQKLPSGEDRMTSREYASLVQDQIVQDLRAEYDTLWSKRSIWDRAYRESRTPSCPAMLLELLSHQNFADMRYGLDPSFRFTVSRAVYKGMLKYISGRYGCDYAVQPLPVKSMAVTFRSGRNDRAVITWQSVEDPLEPTAAPEGYILYTRKDDGAFDLGRDLKGAGRTSDGRLCCEAVIEPGHIYGFRIVPYNDGGLGFPSETVSIGIPEKHDSRHILVVNNFDRVSAPAFHDTPGNAGFDNRRDSGVPYVSDIAYIGDMHEYVRDGQWVSNDNPGFGASYQDHAGKTVAGNTYDYASVHGKAIMKAGHPFCSCSGEAFCTDSSFRAGAWAVDLICGKQVTISVGNGMRQKHTVFTPEMQKALRAFAAGGGNILVSGSYIGTDIWGSVFPVKKDSTLTANSIRFASEVLGYRFAAGQASRTAKVRGVKNPLADYSALGTFGFLNEINSRCYCVESPDGIVPASGSGKTLMRYADTGISAGVGYEGTGHRAVSLGFPIETLCSAEHIDSIIGTTLEFFKK